MDSSEETVRKILSLAGIKINGNRPFDIQIHDKRTYKRALTQRELGAGEAYMDGWWSSAQLDETIARLMKADIKNNLPVTPKLIVSIVAGFISNHQKLPQAKKNAAAHYNIGNDLYELMLDKRMIYTCGFWQNAKNLSEAQEAKLDRICQKLKLKQGMTLLDIGCGWGGFAEYAASKYGVKVTGITLASEQLDLAKQRVKGLPVKILLEDYRLVKGKFDRIVSIGMMEAVGRKNLRTFFKTCNGLLKDDGIMVHHTIINNHDVAYVDPWILKYIFPGGYVPSISQICKAVEDYEVIEDIENFGPDYDKTLMAWYHNFKKNYPKLKDKYDERFYRMWEYYLLSCAGTFRSRQLQLCQFVMRKPFAPESYRGYR